MSSKFLNLSTDTTLGGNSPSDVAVSSQKAVKAYADGLVTNMQTTTNLVTSVSSASTNSQYPSAKLFYDTIGDVETLLQGLR